MADWRKAALPLGATLGDAIRSIDLSALQIALVVDEAGHLKGTVTDGDIRRAILRGETLEAPIVGVMKENPIIAGPEIDRQTVMGWMRKFTIAQVPIVEADGRVIGLELLSELVRPRAKDNWVVIMAGGLGTRLRPLTEDLPKPLIPVGGRPVLETIIERLAEQGFERIFLSVNYQAEKVAAYFKDGGDWGVKISYLEENTRLGTAGALTLLPETPPSAFLVMNADLMTAIDFRKLVEFHEQQAADLTMAVRDYRFQVPYGVVEMAGNRIKAISEKPTQNYFVNSGVYVLTPGVLRHVPKGEIYDMPSLFETVISEGGLASAFPIHEYWIDIGRIEDLERARTEYPEIFVAERPR